MAAHNAAREAVNTAAAAAVRDLRVAEFVSVQSSGGLEVPAAAQADRPGPGQEPHLHREVRRRRGGHADRPVGMDSFVASGPGKATFTGT